MRFCTLQRWVCPSCLREHPSYTQRSLRVTRMCWCSSSGTRSNKGRRRCARTATVHRRVQWMSSIQFVTKPTIQWVCRVGGVHARVEWNVLSTKKNMYYTQKCAILNYLYYRVGCNWWQTLRSPYGGRQWGTSAKPKISTATPNATWSQTSSLSSLLKTNFETSQ